MRSLPILSVDPAKPACWRTCTYRPMRVDPGGLVFGPQSGSPDNRVQVYRRTCIALVQSVAEAGARPLTVEDAQTKAMTTEGLDHTYARS